MTNYAKIVNGVVENIIVADSEWIENESDLYVELNNLVRADIGQEYKNGVFLPKQPYASWTKNIDNSWSAPVNYPSDNQALYVWNEETVSWVLFVIG